MSEWANVSTHRLCMPHLETITEPERPHSIAASLATNARNIIQCEKMVNVLATFDDTDETKEQLIAHRKSLQANCLTMLSDIISSIMCTCNHTEQAILRLTASRVRSKEDPELAGITGIEYHSVPQRLISIVDSDDTCSKVAVTDACRKAVTNLGIVHESRVVMDSPTPLKHMRPFAPCRYMEYIADELSEVLAILRVDNARTSESQSCNRVSATKLSQAQCALERIRTEVYTLSRTIVYTVATVTEANVRADRGLSTITQKLAAAEQFASRAAVIMRTADDELVSLRQLVKHKYR